MEDVSIENLKGQVLADDEEDGVKYKVVLNHSNREATIVGVKDDKTEVEKYKCVYPIIFGVDVCDMSCIEEKLSIVLNRFK